MLHVDTGLKQIKTANYQKVKLIYGAHFLVLAPFLWLTTDDGHIAHILGLSSLSGELN